MSTESSDITVRTNARGEVILPFFVVGQGEPDVQAFLDALSK